METLKTNREFERVFRKGKSAGHRDLVFLGRKGSSRRLRVGFCISRKAGNAVSRNKLRRRLKEIIRELESEVYPKWEIVIVAKETTTKLSFQELRQLTRKLLSRLGARASRDVLPSN